MEGGKHEIPLPKKGLNALRMNMVKAYFRVLLLILCLTLAVSSPAFAITTVKGQYLNNAVFLSHNYVKYTSFVNLVPDLADKMNTTYKVNYLFPNTGQLTSTGTIADASTELAQVKAFLNAIKTFEEAHGVHFNVVAWLNADSTTVDVTNTTVRSTIVNESKKLTSTTITGSYVSRATRAFDGVMLDLEPSGNDDTRYNAYKQLMIDIKNGIGSGKLTGVAAHQYGSGSVWSWSSTYYYYMARNVDLLVGMTYDSGSTSGSAYQAWMQQQATDILHAVSGQTWSNDANHPAPTNGVKVFIGQPAYPSKPSAGHDAAFEAMNYGLSGLDAGITALKNDTIDNSENWFNGAAVYLHTDGTGTDNYASWSTDWWQFGHYWLGSW
ncbi:hypothetical protein [Paenibacillus cremeus]|uniref:Uncharacterized protein n=1 Tax=Paenibacillus cremeus TaxID=2163881 RepID=A0A559K6P8_9BACL|nr:hypothetical protein [Paenibacillus cremeus]TVY07815.1 hypothetical protein FPZ49_21915 [Paenibacillus cremeus]